jgi:hypothetical protein
MKKHLRGKRYIRSRASVQVGRMNRQMHKLDKVIIAIECIDWNAITENFRKVMLEIKKQMETAIRNLPAAFAEISLPPPK